MKKMIVAVLSVWSLMACAAAPDFGVTQSGIAPETLIVCAENEGDERCDFWGQDAIQQAIDKAVSGATIRLRPGVYRPKQYRDVAFQDLLIRGFSVIENKTLSIEGEGEVILEGSLGTASAFVTKNSRVSFANIHLNDFRWGVQEDNTYDGHGIFVIGGEVSIDTVSMRKIQKMGLTVRDAARVEVSKLDIADSHLGVWVNEESVVTIRDSVFRGCESAGLAAYDHSRVNVSHSVFEANEDDGVFASDQARVQLRHSIVVNNKPFGLSGAEQGQIRVESSYVNGNNKDFSDAGSSVHISRGNNMLSADPRGAEG